MIESIDVACRPGKPVGRGLKQIRHVPISETAKALSLPLHEIDTFTGWQPPKPQGKPFNLIIAVSFGLLIPSRIINGAHYGGLNVHPSMLPDLYGPAPLHYTLLYDCQNTGITIQTLHPEKFDQGKILMQTPEPGHSHNCETVSELSDFLASKGARMLEDCIKNRLYLYGSRSEQIVRDSGLPLAKIKDVKLSNSRARHAPKITNEDRFLDFKQSTAREILLKHRVIGPLWSDLIISEGHGQGQRELRRIIWKSGFGHPHPRKRRDLTVGEPTVIKSSSRSSEVYVRTIDDQVLTINDVTISGQQEAPALQAAVKAGIRHPDSLIGDGPLFRYPLSMSGRVINQNISNKEHFDKVKPAGITNGSLPGSITELSI